jgi:hypothetical protein
MAVDIKDGIRATVPDPKTSSNSKVRDAYQIARLLRNAFAHSPFSPKWSIDPDCQNKTFAVLDVITLDMTGLQGAVSDWRHYGGPLALFRLCRFVRTKILRDNTAPRKIVPIPESVIFKQGDVIFERV